MDVFDRMESEVRGYCRSWPTVFTAAQGSHMTDENGKTYLDFFAGAGTLNYGHNNPGLKRRLLDFLAGDPVVHGLDMYTSAKREFLERFNEYVLAPRDLDYKVQFPGPAGNNSVEAALKLARKYTGRETVVSFTNAFHGMTLGALAVTGNSMKRTGAGVPLGHGVAMPYDNYLDGRTPDFLLFETMLDDSGSGLDKPAAVIVETVQGEGGINVATAEWLRGLQDLCHRQDILLIVDDVQMGCGRTGPFFSFEEAGITPDIVCLSKSLSGYGLPFAITLMKRELDVWEPGEHNGTFRGFNPAFITAVGALEDYWTGDDFEKQTLAKGQQVQAALNEIAIAHAGAIDCVRGRGMAWGLVMKDPETAPQVCGEAFARGLLMETSGPEGEVVKLLPPLTTTESELATGLEIIADSVEAVRQKITA
ncbi:diaminobutyrate--2-oxoglutarate transaminase [Actinomadura luteofluorescens]|uniref:diaminobutyrate--2-oxoglutarate transaminase n=1 Tax=Actinomadura luteofluorescens TaxID=46163 RepID=UPI002164B747|nr:diaminobutyrate--2-oxoglutarate transaminase [Actinomadura glauciflava]MCR3738277.1 diaminobutyrate aminotransferase apoenzyme (EC 2.6.1.76) [Actinomadura glauciflava]